MNYRFDLHQGIFHWLNGDYESACPLLLSGVDSFGQINPGSFMLRGLQPGQNFLGTIADGLNGGERVIAGLRDSFWEVPLPHNSYHIGWMHPLLIVLFTLTDANWLMRRDAGGYLALVQLDDLYLAALTPAGRRVMHHNRNAPIFEYAIGRALAWEVNAAATIAEHMTSPLLKDIFGSVHPEQYPVQHVMPREYEAAQRLRTGVHIDYIQEHMTRIAQQGKTTAEELLCAKRSALLNLLEKSLYNQICLDPELEETIRAWPSATAAQIVAALKANEALVLTSSYEDSFIFFVFHDTGLVHCFSTDKSGRGTYDKNVAAKLDESGLGMFYLIYAAPANAVSSLLDCLGVTFTGLSSSSLKNTLFGADYTIEAHKRWELAVGEFAKLKAARQHIPSSAHHDGDGDHNLGAELERFDNVFWVTTFPLNIAPMHILSRQKFGCYVPSGSLLVAVRSMQQVRSKTNRALLYSDPLSNLPRSAEEGLVVEQTLISNGIEVVHLEKHEATRRYFIDNICNFDLFHYSGHGCGQSENGSGTCLEFADGMLTLADLINAKPFLRFAFLNNCYSGQQKGAPYGELTGAANLFLTTGTVSVFAPTVPILDEMAFQISCRFYDHMSSGKTVRDIVQQLMEEMEAFHPNPQMIYRLYGLPETIIV